MANLVTQKGSYSTVKYNGAYYVRENFKAVEGPFYNIEDAVNSMERLCPGKIKRVEVNDESQK
jgi:hypothetical protein